nr:hypothetical protein [Tanacetum cinerariifolium]
MESIFETTSRIDEQTPTSVALLPITTPTMTSSTIATTTTTSQAPILPTIVSSNIIQHLPSFSSLFRFDDRLRSLEESFSEVMQTNQFASAVSAIPGIVQHYIDQRMNEAVKVVVQIQSDREGKEPESASAPTETATRSAGRSTRGSRSRQVSASESAFAEEPVQTTSQMENPSHLEFDTGADDQPIVQSSQDLSCQKIKTKTFKRPKSKSRDQKCKFIKVTRRTETASVSKIMVEEGMQKFRD